MPKLRLDPFYDADDGSGEGGAPSGDPNGGEGGKPNGESGQPKPELTIPKTRFDEINRKYKETTDKLNALLEAQRQADEEAKKKSGQFEELYATATKDVDTYKTKATQYEGRASELEALLGTMFEARLATIPEDLRELIPDNLKPEEKLAWLEKATAKGLFTKKPDEPVGGRTNPGEKQTDKPPQVRLKEAEDKARKTGRIEDRIAVAQLKRELNL